MSSAGTEVLLSLAQQPELCSALTTLWSLAASALGSWESWELGWQLLKAHAILALACRPNGISAFPPCWVRTLGKAKKKKKQKWLSVCDTAVKRHRR